MESSIIDGFDGDNPGSASESRWASLGTTETPERSDNMGFRNPKVFLLDLLETLYQTGALVPLMWALTYVMAKLWIAYALPLLVKIVQALFSLLSFSSQRSKFRSAMRALGIVPDADGASVIWTRMHSVMEGAGRCGMCKCWWCLW